MKKTSILILLALMAFAPMAWAQQQFSGGSGTETDPYLISSVEDWNTLADNVKDGNPYSGLYFQMTADIDVGGKMVGKSNSKSFQGIFDGNGHTLTFNKKIDGKYIAPFHYAKNATFKRLHTAGKIQEKDHIASFERYGGIAGRICGNCNFISCRSSVKLDLDYHTDKYDEQKVGNHGGFVGEIDFGTAIFINCLYDGAIDLRNQGGSGGFVGFIDYDDNLVTATFINCLVAPTSVKLQYCTPCTTYVGGNKHNTSYSLHNCYYRHKIEDKEGIDATSMTNAELIAALGNGWEEVDGKVVPKNMDYYTFTAGDGSSETPYQIASSTDWNNLASNILMGANYSGKYFQLTQNIEVTETVSADGLPVNMLGVNKSLSFRGTFDGDGHTITINYTDNRTGSGNENHYCGPFRIINGATIANLHVAGTIRKEDKKHAGGIVGKAFGQNQIRNCRSSVTIESNTDGDGSHGGFIGDLREGYTELAFCLFDGKMQGPNGASSRTTKWGGFIGWVADDGEANFKHCLFAPTDIKIDNKSGCRTFARRDDGDDVTFNNCYYIQSLGSSQGKQALSISGNENVNMTPYGEPNPNNVSGITPYRTDSYSFNPGLEYGGMYYAGNGDEVLLNLSQNGATPDGAQANSFIATPGSLSGTSSPYTLNMPNTNTTISLATTDFATGHFGLYNDPYPIYTTEQWNLLAERVNSGNTDGYEGIYFKLMADITVTSMVGSDDTDNKSFRGIFDGNGHTLNLSLSGSGTDGDAGTAPFKYISGATIKNLHVTGSITTTGMRPASIASFVVENSTITNCWSEVAISSSRSSDIDAGGFVARVNNGKTLTLTDCLFSGSITYSNSSGFEGGGMVGYTQDNATATLTNCYFAPSSVSFAKSSDLKMYMLVGGKRNHVTINNCYYNNVAAAETKLTVEGTNASGMSNEALREALGEAWEVKNNQVVPIMTRYLFSGAGNSASSPYLISSVEDWNGLVGNVYLGENYTYTYFQLTDDISVTRMVGTTNNAFKGHFDGDGNTLTFTANTSADYTAPFRYVDGADIQNLIVDGTITTSAKYAAGFIGRAGSINSSTSGSISITNCRSGITINSSVNGDGTHGGFIANIHSGSANITGCVFNGSLLGNDTENCGGFVGWTRTEYNYASLTISNSLFAPTSGENPVSSEGSYTFSRYSTGSNYVTILSSYYTQALGATNGQGRQAYSITAGEYVTMEIVGDSTEYEVSGLTLYPVGIEFNDVLYAGNADAVSLNLSSEIPEGFTFNGYNASNGGILSGEDPYTLTMPNDNVTVTADYSIEWPGEGTEENPYRIYQPVQLDLLATRVNGTNGETQNSYTDTYFKVMNDIEYDANVADNYTAIGYEYGYPFNGHFDGQDYTISGINSIQPVVELGNVYNGLFGYLNTGAEVKNIVLANTTIGDGGMAGGIAARSKGTITNCHVKDDVTINGTEQTSACHGGVVGTNEGILSHCTFAGTLTKTFSDPDPDIVVAAYSYGGIAGMNNQDATLSDNLVVGAIIPSTMLYYGAVTGISAGNLSRNYYVGCTVAGTPNASGVGVSIRSNGYQRTDVTDNDGAVPGYLLTLDENITSDALAITVPAHGETEEVTYNVAASGNTITLGYELSNALVTYYVNNEALQGNTFTMPAEDVTVSAVFMGITKDITAHGTTTAEGGWYLIASPLEGSIAATSVSNLVAANAADFDLYRFNQAAEYEWENWKKEGDHYQFELESGRGYLYANSEDVTLVFPGTPYSGDGEVTLTKTEENVAFAGWNLVGNPFAETAYIAGSRDFYVMNPDGNEIIAAVENSIAPIEGIFVIANTDGETMTFTTTEPDPEGNDKSITLNLGQGRGLSTGSRTAVVDRAIVRFGEGRQLPKFQIRNNSTKLYIPKDNVDYAVVNAEAQGEMPINFKAKEDGQYTLSLGSENVAFSYLHLIDNMTGADVDLLDVARNVSTAPSYTFTAKTTDYESRFRLVFSADETDGPSTGSGTFAFISDGNIIINGTGTLQVIDLLGRQLSSQEIHSAFRIPHSAFPKGVYVLRLIDGNDVKTQKIVVR